MNVEVIQNHGMRFRRLKAWLSQTLDQLEQHEVFRLSAAIAYTTALAIAPLLLVILSIVAFLDLGIRSDILGYLYEFIGQDTAKAMDIIISSAQDQKLTTGSGFFGLIILAISASAIFSQLRQALDRIGYSHTTIEPSTFIDFLKDKIVSVAMVFAFIALLVFSIFITTVVSYFFMPSDAMLASFLNFLINFAIFVCLYTMLYRYVPSKRIGWRRSLISASVTAACFVLGKYLIGVYLSRSIVSNSVGALGTIIVFLIWVYYVSLITLVSYEFTNAFFIHRRKRREAKPT